MNEVTVCHICSLEYEGWWSDQWNLVPAELIDKELCISCFEKTIQRECVVQRNIGGMDTLGNKGRYSIFVIVKG